MFAKAVNAAAAESGVFLQYQRPSVAQWLAGGVPRPPVPELIAEVLTRKLGRPVTIQDAGFIRPGKGALDSEEVEEALRDLARRSVAPGRAGAVPGDVYRLGALQEALGEARLGITWAVRKSGGRRVGKVEAAAATSTLQLFSRVDKAFGGGYVRPALANYLSTVLVPWLRAPSSPTVTSSLHSTAAQLAYLCAFAHFDDQEQALAQRYYLNALRLAARASDTLTMAVVLRGLSVQAYTLGHRVHAQHLAEAAHARCPSWAPRHLRAALLGQRALTAASLGNSRQALNDLISAEQYVDREPNAPAPTPVGSYHTASLAHQRGEVAIQLGDFAEAHRAFTHAVCHRPPMEHLARVLVLHKLASLELSQGQLDAACHYWQRFLHDQTALHSQRAADAITEMRSRLRPYSTNATASSLLHLATAPRRSPP
ncbi:hypothetical protein [Streptomyces lavendulocolor]|uniref:hypothetical protein n=1 Tax=Streptomyces lavendulocolor TaxID=67316 RepID=UPI0033CE7756